MAKAGIGLIGLAVMGENLTLNIESQIFGSRYSIVLSQR
jgi:6-phosphogluconate dehydrogenase